MSFNAEKRICKPTGQQLEIQLDHAMSELSKTLRTKLSIHQNNPDDLQCIASQCKAQYSDFYDFNCQLIEFKLKNGSPTVADELRLQKMELKQDVREFIGVVNTYLEQLSNIELIFLLTQVLLLTRKLLN